MITFMTVNIVCEIMSTLFFPDLTFVSISDLICSSVNVLGQQMLIIALLSIGFMFTSKCTIVMFIYDAQRELPSTELQV